MQVIFRSDSHGLCLLINEVPVILLSNIRPVSTCLLLALVTPAFAQDVPDVAVVPDTIETEESSAPVDLVSDLQAELALMSEKSDATIETLTAAEALLDAAKLLADGRLGEEERVAGAQGLGALADARAVPFLWMGVRDQSKAVRAAVYTASASYPGADTLAMGILGLNTESGPEAKAAAALLVAQKSPEAGEALYNLAESATVSGSARKFALEALVAGYPELVVEKGEPAAVSSNIGMGLMAGANALLGGVSLSTLGHFGQSDAAITIGALGGAGIGAGGSVMYSRLNPVTEGQGFAYASGTSWGLLSGLLLGEIFLPGNEGSNWESVARGRAAFRAAGVLAGAKLGSLALDDDPQWRDVMEVNVGGYLGSQIGIGVASLFNPDQFKCGVDYYDDYYGYGYDDVDGCRDDRRDWEDNRDRINSGMALIGAGIGAGLGYSIHRAWEPGPEEIAFATVAGFEGLALGVALPMTIAQKDPDEAEGSLRLGFHLGATAGLAYAHFRPVSYDQTVLAGWGAGFGHLLGLGVSSLSGLTLRDDDGQATSGVVSALGAAGFASGVWQGEGVSLNRNDRFLMGTGTVLGGWNSILGSVILVDYGASDEVVLGLSATGSALAGLGSAYAATRLDIDQAYSAFVGTSASWGVFYAGSMLVAFEPDWESSTYLMMLLATSDLAAGAAAWAGSSKGFLDPKDTAIASLGGMTGATLGSLAMFMITDDQEPVAIGAMVGATAGLVGGALLTPKIRNSRKPKEQARRVLPDLPGEWSMDLSPTVLENGEMGAYVGVKAFGW
jgi:hypothetical protein